MDQITGASAQEEDEMTGSEGPSGSGKPALLNLIIEALFTSAFHSSEEDIA